MNKGQKEFSKIVRLYKLKQQKGQIMNKLDKALSLMCDEIDKAVVKYPECQCSLTEEYYEKLGDIEEFLRVAKGVTKTKLIDWLVDNDTDTILQMASQGDNTWLHSVLKNGIAGYNTQTKKELLQEYYNRTQG